MPDVSALPPALRAFVRAVVHGKGVAEVDLDAVYGGGLVESASRPHLYHRVQVRPTNDHVLHFSCTCEAGFFRPDQTCPCWHSAAVAVWLCDVGGAVLEHDRWRIHPDHRIPDLPVDVDRLASDLEALR